MLRPAIRSPVLRRTFIVPRASRFTTPIVIVSIAFSTRYDSMGSSDKPPVNQHPRIADWAAFSSETGKPPRDPGATSPSTGGPSQHKLKLRKESPGGRNHRYDHWNSFWEPNAGTCSKSPVFQDVRCRGPLFNLSKTELDDDPEAAKQQWRRLVRGVVFPVLST